MWQAVGSAAEAGKDQAGPEAVGVREGGLLFFERSSGEGLSIQITFEQRPWRNMEDP